MASGELMEMVARFGLELLCTRIEALEVHRWSHIDHKEGEKCPKLVFQRSFQALQAVHRLIFVST